MRLYFWFRESAKKDIGSVYCEVYIDGEKSVPYSTKIKVPRKCWNAADQCFEGKNSSKYEKTLIRFSKRLEEIKDEIEAESPGALVTGNEVINRHRDELKREKTSKKKKVIYFRDCLREFMKAQSRLVEFERIEPDTYEVANSKVKIIMKYLADQNLERIRPLQITEAFMTTLKEHFIENDYADSTIAKYEYFIKRVLKYSRQKGLIVYSPIEDLKIDKPEENDPIYVTPRELSRMLKFSQGNPTYEKVMDIYCFCCYTSLSYIDYYTLHEGNIETEEDGTIWIFTARDKTETKQRIPLHDAAVKILEQYEGIENLPKMSNQKLNEYIKEIADIAKIDKYLTFHSSRRFYVDYLVNTKRVDSLIIEQVVGWKDANRMIKRYAVVSMETIKDKLK